MTGPINAAAGLVTAPSYTFNGASKTGFYLAGANQIGWAANGVQGATFNSDLTSSWAGSATFTGTLAATKGTVPIGAVADFAGSTAPSGWLLCFGQLVSTTTYAARFVQLGTTYGSGAGTFGIPDYRGRATLGQDNMGGSAANRITATVNYDGTVLGNSGGGQSTTILTTNLPPYTPTVASFNLTFPVAQINTSGQINAAETDSNSPTGSGHVQGSITMNPQGGTSTAFTNLPPSMITNKIIFAGV